MTVSNELIDEMLAGLEGVTPGPWLKEMEQDEEEDFPSFYVSSAVTTSCNLTVVAKMGEASANARTDASHIARCDPDTMRSILTELRDRRASPSGVAVKGDEALRKEIRLSAAIFEAVASGRQTMNPAIAGSLVDLFNRILSCLTPPHSITPEGGEETCATEGCERPATNHFERGGVGSWHCDDCLTKIVERLTPPIPTGEAEPVAWRDCLQCQSSGYDGLVVCSKCGGYGARPVPNGVAVSEELIAAAQNVYAKLAGETTTVTIFDQERLGDALAALEGGSQT